MFQQMMGMMIELMLAKFMFNDVPHAIGLIDNPKTLKPYRYRVRELIPQLRDATFEESHAAMQYLEWSDAARASGYIDIAEQLQSIAEDEARHHRMVSTMVKELSAV